MQKLFLIFLVYVNLHFTAFGEEIALTPDETVSQLRQRVPQKNEHLYFGNPSDREPMVRQGYVTEYDATNRVPRWVAYHITEEYLSPPSRNKAARFGQFREDPDANKPVKDGDYTNSGYARGHLAPYAVMGGDRNGNGKKANPKEALSDPVDEQTIFQSMYMSNITPQWQKGFNGSKGAWFNVERWEQDEVVRAGGNEAWVFAGVYFDPKRKAEFIGPNKDIRVPTHFFKIVVYETEKAKEPRAFAYWFEHRQTDNVKLPTLLKTVRFIESKVKLDFMRDLPDEIEEKLEKADGKKQWELHSEEWSEKE